MRRIIRGCTVVWLLLLAAGVRADQVSGFQVDTTQEKLTLAPNMDLIWVSPDGTAHKYTAGPAGALVFLNDLEKKGSSFQWTSPSYSS